MKDSTHKWRKVLKLNNTKDGYSANIYQKPSPFAGTPIDLLRLETNFKNCNKEHWIKAFEFGAPVKNLKSNEIIERVNENEYVFYQVMSMPIMSDRDNVIRWKRIEVNDKQTMLVIQSVNHKDRPAVPGKVRGQIINIQLIKQDDANPADLSVVEFTSADMKGYFPSRLMNMALANIISKGIVDINAKIRQIQA